MVIMARDQGDAFVVSSDRILGEAKNTRAANWQVTETVTIGYNWGNAINHTQEPFVVEQSREVEQAVSALTTEILKLTPLEGDQLAALSVTVENAFTRLAVAILAQSNQTQEETLEEAIPAASA
jgi:hypothetical protein